MISTGGKSRMPVLAALRFPQRFQRNREIHLPFECIDARNKNTHFIAHAESFPRSSPNQLSPPRLK
jgi:hypothetical protein